MVRAGAAPVLIPHLTDETRLRVVYEQLDGVLLPGGEDVDPAQYGEPVHEKCGPTSPHRDKVELMLSRWVVDEGKPVLAICRGIQVLNVALGGSLYQDIRSQVPEADEHTWYPNYPRDRLSHTLTVTPGTRLAHLTSTTRLPVNSLHHQAVNDVASGLTVSARSPDGLVEALEADGHPFAIAVQWHPEELADSDVRAQRLFDALVIACQT
jgi:putative glutamine amidotransferase